MKTRVQRIILLKPAEERALLLKARAGDLAARNELVERNMGFIWQRALYWWRKIPGWEEEDLVGFGVIGLIRGIERIDLRRKVRLMTYCGWAIDREIRLRAHVHSGLIRQPSCRRLKIPVTSIDGVYCGDDGSSESAQLCAEPEVGDEFLVDGIPALHAAIRDLPGRLRIVIERRLAGKKLWQIGDELGVTNERVRQLEAKALKLLRSALSAA